MSRVRTFYRAVVAGAVALVGLGSAFASPVVGQEPDGPIRWEAFTLEVGDSAVSAELGRLTVPEVRAADGRAAPGAGQVELAFVRLASRAADPGPPIVYLDGGPGGSGYGIARSPAYYRLFDALREVSDVILLSQRGAGLSEPRLLCRLQGRMPDDLFTTRSRILEALGPEVEACAQSWRERGADLSGYTTRESADDLESLRRALGADALSLLGFSYGTHLGLAAIRRHEDRIARAVLVGTEGPDHTYKLPSTADLQLEHLSERMAGDPAVGAFMPDFAAAVDTLLGRLDTEPVALTIRTRQGERTIRLGGDGMRYLIRRDLGDTNDHPVWPVAFRATLDGEYGMLTRLAARRFNELAGVPLMAILMDCASGASPERLARIEAEEPGSALGAMTNLWYPEACAAVPEAVLDDGFRGRFTAAVPTLFVTGTLDANTPPHQAHYVSWGWPNAAHLTVEGAGHEGMLPYAPVQDVIVDFFSGRDVSDRRVPARALEFLTPEEVR